MHVLIIDDDPDIRAVLRTTCHDEGWETIEAEHGADGLALLASASRPLVTLLDYRMPIMDGLQVLRMVEAHSALQIHSYLLITANPTTLPPELLRLAKRLRIQILPKPFDLDEVADAIESAAVRTLPLAVVTRSPAQGQSLIH